MLCACGTDNPTANRYCESCGARLFATCPSCNYKNTSIARFCGSCGVSLTTVAHGAFRPRSLGPERKQATVLFADIVDSTPLVAGIDPEQAMEYLRPAVGTMCEAVEHFGGTVIQTLGDGVMALFGAPRAQEGHALLACQASIMLQQRFPPDARFRVRVGLHSGEIVAEGPEQDLSLQRSAHGGTIHLMIFTQRV
jgi:class 3 adenylate cyclase